MLSDLVKGYNASTHSSIKMAPKEVTLKNERQVWNTLYGKPRKHRKPTLEKGDMVRLNKIHRPFAKGYLPGWTEEVFLVDKVKPFPAYKITEWDGTPCRWDLLRGGLTKSLYDRCVSGRKST